jgi:hypothetical protein
LLSADLIAAAGPSTSADADDNQLQALRLRTRDLLNRLGVGDDVKLADWLEQRIGLLQQRDTAMLHRLLHDIEKTSQSKMLSYYFIWSYVLIIGVWMRKSDELSGCYGVLARCEKRAKSRNSLT